ncbi:MAG: hypothetical protein H6709_00320 [Kofleriaceae bacterium]|nr:hypothetical protein [Myxococcales bacterium]MCB9558931.1 hypothetical protein [Kofleriaceae bacterium]MCB9570511.1 hypothetical protein [Kofleriaceae bacterium]
MRFTDANVSPTPALGPAAGAEAPVELSPRDLLDRAARAAVDAGLDLDVFMQQAWNAFVEAQPGLREHLEYLQTLARLEELRQQGKIGQA